MDNVESTSILVSKPKGFGGLLILPLIYIAFQLFIWGRNFINNLIGFSSGESGYMDLIFLIISFVVLVGIMLLTYFIVYTCTKEMKAFKRFVVAAITLITLVDVIWAVIGIVVSEMSGLSWLTMLMVITAKSIPMAIVLAYMLRSRRVRNTYINPFAYKILPMTIAQALVNLGFVIAAFIYYNRMESNIEAKRFESLTSLLIITLLIYMASVILYLRSGSLTFLITVFCSLYLTVASYNLYQGQMSDKDYFSIGFSKGWQMLSNQFLDKSRSLYYWLIVLTVINVVLLLFMRKLRTRMSQQNKESIS